jgi:serine/threonine protein kinase
MAESKWGDEKSCDAKDDAKSSSKGWDHIDFSEIEIGEKIGGGGLGVIYSGRWKGEPVALKTLFDSRIGEELKKEYMDELLVMSKLRHSNIVQFLGACMTPPNLCFVMEQCECSLYNLLHSQRIDFSDKECVEMATDIAYALEYLHSLSPAIIHRDLKSHNILRAHNGALKLCDFGLVMIKNTAAGTPAYMAPELFENRSFNKSVDVYAFGVVVWEIFAKDTPFKMLPIEEIKRRVCSGERLKIPSWVPARVAGLISRCWAQRSDDRPSFTEIVDELLEIAEEVRDTKHTQVINECMFRLRVFEHVV